MKISLLFALPFFAFAAYGSPYSADRPLDPGDTIYNSTLLFAWFDDILNSPLLEARFAKSTETEVGLHDRAQIDTVIHYRTAFSVVNILATPNKRLLLASEILDSEITLSNQIKIGTSVEIVKEVLAVDSINDGLVIHEELGYGVYIHLFFEDARLVRISVYSNVD